MSISDEQRNRWWKALADGDLDFIRANFPSVNRSQMLMFTQVALTNDASNSVAKFLLEDCGVAEWPGAKERMLSAVARAGLLESVDYVLQLGVEDMYLELPLVGAARSGKVEVVQRILDAGADPNQGNPGFVNALDEAIAAGFDDVAALLKQHGAQPGVCVYPKDSRDRTKHARDYPGGSRRFVHSTTEHAEVAAHSPFRDELSRLLIKAFGEPTRTFSDPEADAVDLKVYAVPPAKGRFWKKGRDYWTLFTLGMSDRPMEMPHGALPPRRGELMMRVPATWDPDASGSPETGWLLTELFRMAKLPHRHRTGLAVGDTIPNGEPPQPFSPNTALCCWLLMPPDVMEEMVLRPATDVEVHVMALFALHESEMAVKLQEGLIPLMKALSYRGMSTVVDPNRAPAKR